MSEEPHVITQNWLNLVKISETRDLATYLCKAGYFTDQELTPIFYTNDERHNNRMFFFALQKKSRSVLRLLEQWLKNNGYNTLSCAIAGKNKGATPYNAASNEINDDDEDEEPELTSSIESANETVHINNSTIPLNVYVKLASEFYDSVKHNPNVEFYNSRSKRRGRVLILNNYDFRGTEHKYRKGALVDEENLDKLFTQMGGWDIEKHSNLTAEQMRLIFKKFTEYKKDKICDISCVFVMSHGSEVINETIIYGIDNNYIKTTDIQNFFKTKDCKLFKGKPKLFIYQVCRGSEPDLRVRHTEVDSINRQASVSESPKEHPAAIGNYFRSMEDMFVGYATLNGYKAHRDPYRGTWYIELICQTFMNLASHESIDHLFMKVDEGLRKRMSESHTMQTSESQNKGFKKLYLNPGIYEENGILKRFQF